MGSCCQLSAFVLCTIANSRLHTGKPNVVDQHKGSSDSMDGGTTFRITVCIAQSG